MNRRVVADCCIIVHLYVVIYSFLAKRGVKEEIQTFDARKITGDTRKGVEKLMAKCGASFEPKVWVVAYYSMV